MPSARAAKAMLLAGCLALFLGACGRTQAVGGDRVVKIALTEYRVAPQRLSAHPGPLTLLVHNFGRLPHNLAITRGGQLTAETAPIRPGTSAILSLEVRSGSYVLSSTLFDDQGLGTYGSLVVSR